MRSTFCWINSITFVNLLSYLLRFHIGLKVDGGGWGKEWLIGLTDLSFFEAKLAFGGRCLRVPPTSIWHPGQIYTRLYMTGLLPCKCVYVTVQCWEGYTLTILENENIFRAGYFKHVYTNFLIKRYNLLIPDWFILTRKILILEVRCSVTKHRTKLKTSVHVRGSIEVDQYCLTPHNLLLGC